MLLRQQKKTNKNITHKTQLKIYIYIYLFINKRFFLLLLLMLLFGDHFKIIFLLLINFFAY